MEKEFVIKKLNSIKHPAIDYSLIKLGILTKIKIVNGKLMAEFAFPFPNIPIADTLIASVADKIEEMKLDFEYTTRVMNEKERQHFLQLETEAWTGS